MDFDQLTTASSTSPESDLSVVDVETPSLSNSPFFIELIYPCSSKFQQFIVTLLLFFCEYKVVVPPNLLHVVKGAHNVVEIHNQSMGSLATDFFLRMSVNEITILLVSTNFNYCCLMNNSKFIFCCEYIK